VKRRRNASPVEKRTLEVDDEVRGPELPADVLPQGEDWHPRTVAWWDTWRRSAQAQEFTDTDWDFLLDTALMHHTMWAKARWEFAAELRLRAAKFGATPEDRMRLRLTVQTPGEQPKEQSGSPAEVTARRRNLHIAG
jgi:hypothetical protein